MGSFTPAFGVVVSKKRRLIIKTFREAGATSAATARSVADLGLPQSVVLEVQKLTGVIVAVGGDRFYLDEGRERSAARWRLGVIVAALALGVLLIVFRGALFGG